MVFIVRGEVYLFHCYCYLNKYISLYKKKDIKLTFNFKNMKTCDLRSNVISSVLLFLVFLLNSCVREDVIISKDDLNKPYCESESRISSKLSKDQALAYVDLFGANLEVSSVPISEKRSLHEPKKISHIDYYIENGDTLLFAVNYANDKGFVILSGDNSSFPILAHSNEGNLNFKNIKEGNPFHLILLEYKKKVKRSLENPNGINSEYYEKWKDLGNKNFQYEITPLNGEPEAAKLRARKQSSNKKAIYPYTGKALNDWCQNGSFNDSAPNKAAIGCPAMAIGMLLYDCEYRLTGSHTSTNPKFFREANQATMNNESGILVSKILRQIADSIPDYDWGYDQNKESGATPINILSGLHKLGFQNAELVSYDFETLYKNLSFRTAGYGGVELEANRGILIGAFHMNGYGGHIWFCDGYYEQAFTVTKKFLFIKIKSWTEYDDRLYMNWGWGSNGGNGWYGATDNVWTSLEHKNVEYKLNPMIFINLNSYKSNENE